MRRNKKAKYKIERKGKGRGELGQKGVYAFVFRLFLSQRLKGGRGESEGHWRSLMRFVTGGIMDHVFN